MLQVDARASMRLSSTYWNSHEAEDTVLRSSGRAERARVVVFCFFAVLAGTLFSLLGRLKASKFHMHDPLIEDARFRGAARA